MIEFTLADKHYRAEKLSAIKQFHVSRRLAPLISPLIPVFLRAAQPGGIGADLSGLSDLLRPVTDGLASMPDAEMEYILDACLGVVRREQEKNWAPIWSADAHASMFADLNDMALLLQIVGRVIQDSLGPFFQGLLTSQQIERATT